LNLLPRRQQGTITAALPVPHISKFTLWQSFWAYFRVFTELRQSFQNQGDGAGRVHPIWAAGPRLPWMCTSRRPPGSHLARRTSPRSWCPFCRLLLCLLRLVPRLALSSCCQFLVASCMYVVLCVPFVAWARLPGHRKRGARGEGGVSKLQCARSDAARALRQVVLLGVPPMRLYSHTQVPCL
jgi:hypothetical protein